MEIGYKPTTHGRALLAALLALEKPLKISRVAFGSGRVPDGTNLADVHELVHYVADGTVEERRHEEDRYYMTVQYANASPEGHRTIPLFYIGEFMVYATDPTTGEEVDLLYATLGDYQTPMPKYSTTQGAVVFNLPLVLIVSDEIEVTIDAEAGLITYEDMQECVDAAVKEATKDVGGIVKTIYFSIAPTDWRDAGSGTYPMYADITNEDIAKSQVPQVVFDEDSLDIAAAARVCKAQNSYTGYVRIKAKAAAAAEISGVLYMIGKATGSGGGGGEYDLPTATRTRLGGVMIGDGLNYKADGTTYVDKDAVAEDVTPKVMEDASASDESVDDMIHDVFGNETTAEADESGN